MNPFTQQITWPGWKFGVLKISMIVFGILIGLLFADFFRPMTVGLWIAFGVTTVLSTVWGAQAMLKHRGPGSG